MYASSEGSGESAHLLSLLVSPISIKISRGGSNKETMSIIYLNIRKNLLEETKCK